MTIVGLDPDLEPLYLVCLEDGSSEIEETGDHKRCWNERAKRHGLRVKVALDDRGDALWMRAAWFRKHGYRKADRMGIQVLLWEPFVADALPPRWIRTMKRPERVPGTATVVAFVNRWCQAMNPAAERARRVRKLVR